MASLNSPIFRPFSRSGKRLPASQHGVEPEIKVGSTGILFDNDGSLWITSLGDGMRRVPFQPTGVEIGHTRQIVEASGGALWLAETARSVHPLLRLGLPGRQGNGPFR